LLTGAWVRLAAALGIAQSLAIGLSVAFGPAEWPWSYWMMISIHAYLLVSSAGRIAAVDAVRSGLRPSRPLVQAWGGLAVLIGLVSALLSLSDPLSSSGEGLSSTDLSISLGTYNVLGGVLLAVTGGLLLASARSGGGRLATVAGVIAVLSGLSLHAQLGFSDPILGGSPTSAAFYFCVAVVAFFAVRPAQEGRGSTSSSPASRQHA